MDAGSFVQLMQALLSGYIALKKLGLEKQEVLVRGDVEALERLLEQENALLARNHHLERKREAWLEGWKRETGQASQEVHMKQVIHRVCDAPLQQQLQELAQKLIQVVQDLQEVNAQNRMLIKHALAFVEQNLSLLLAEQQSQPYDRSGVRSVCLWQQRSWVDQKV